MNGMVLLKQSQKIMAALTLVLLAIWGMGLSYANQFPQSLQQISGQTNYDEVGVLGRGSANSIAWSPDGKSLVVAGSLGIWLYENDFQTITHLVDNSHSVGLISWSPDGTRIVGRQGTNINIWDATDGTLMLPIQGDNDGSRVIRWNNDGSRLATVDQDQAIRIWDTSDGHLLGTLDDHIDSIYDVAWSPDGALLASAAWDGSVYVWNATTFETVGDFQMPNARFSSIDWGPTNLIAVSSEQQIYIINPSTTDLVQTIGGSTDTIRTLKWSPDGTMLASGAGQVISLWNGTNFQFEDTLVGHLNFILDLAWRPDSGALASTSGGNSSLDNSVYVWNTSTGEIAQSIKGHTGSIETLAWVSDNEQIGSGSLGGEISIWNATETEAELITTIPLAANNIGWNTNGTLLAGSYVEQLRVWNWTDLFNDSLGWQSPPSVGSLEYVEMSYDDITNDFMSLMWSPDGEQIAISTADGFARILNSLSGNVLSSLEHDSQVVWRIAWSPDGQQVVTSANDVTIWDVAREAEVATLDPFAGTFWQFAWSPDGGRIVGGTIEGDTLLWNVTDHHMLWVTSDGIRVNALAWHPSGNMLAIGKNDGTIVLVDANTNIEITTLTGHNGPVTALAWNSDGTQLASGGEDGTIRIWVNQ